MAKLSGNFIKNKNTIKIGYDIQKEYIINKIFIALENYGRKTVKKFNEKFKKYKDKYDKNYLK